MEYVRSYLNPIIQVLSPIIRLVLSPIVENAIYHGLKYKDSRGLLTVHGYRKDENVVIDIMDDGVGMDEETLKHIGMISIR